mmetsp:Transcript_52027/g.104634  ORF Transcript_52027/g.104634 Transcript_52027/m.104634 type:complete len:359 (-) Transcript_52027:21-1097(-)
MSCLDSSSELSIADDGSARVKLHGLLSRGRVAVFASVGTFLLGAAFLYGANLRQAQSDAPLEAAVGGLVTLDDAAANLGTCVIDADQAAFYLMQGVNFIRFAEDTCKVAIGVEAQSACSASVTTVIASFGWVGSYTAAAINSCGSETNIPAACAASMSGFVALLGELGFISSSVVNACDPAGFIQTTPHPPEKKHKEGGKVATPHLDTAQSFFGKLANLKKLNEEKEEKPEEVVDNSLRGWSISQCVVDLNLGVTYVARMGIQAYFLSRECPQTESNYDRKKCALDVWNLISSVAWAAQFLSLAAFDCPESGSLDAACAGVVSDFVAVVAALGPIVNGIADDCQPMLSGAGVGYADFA